MTYCESKLAGNGCSCKTTIRTFYHLAQLLPMDLCFTNHRQYSEFCKQSHVWWYTECGQNTAETGKILCCKLTSRQSCRSFQHPCHFLVQLLPPHPCFDNQHSLQMLSKNMEKIVPVLGIQIRCKLAPFCHQLQQLFAKSRSYYTSKSICFRSCEIWNPQHSSTSSLGNKFCSLERDQCVHASLNFDRGKRAEMPQYIAMGYSTLGCMVWSTYWIGNIGCFDWLYLYFACFSKH